MRGRTAPAICPALGNRRPRNFNATAPTASPPEAQRTRQEDVVDGELEPQLRARLEDARASEPEPHAAPCYVCGQAHGYSAIYTPLLAHVYGNVSLESPPASLFHRGNGALRSAMYAAINLAGLGKTGMGDKWLRQDPDARRLACLAQGFRLQMCALREEAWHDGDSRRWGSAFDFTQKRVLCARRPGTMTAVAGGAPHSTSTRSPRGSLAASKRTAAQRRLLLRPSRVSHKPTRRPKPPSSRASRNGARISLLVAARK
jgi:hypothetical protein